MKKIISLFLLIAVALFGCSNGITEQIITKDDKITFTATTLSSDKRLHTFFVDKGDKIKFPYELIKAKDGTPVIKVGKKISRKTYDYIFEKEIHSEEKGTIEVTIEESGKYHIVIGNLNAKLVQETPDKTVMEALPASTDVHLTVDISKNN